MGIGRHMVCYRWQIDATAGAVSGWMTYVFKIQAGVLMYFLFIIYLTLNLKLVRLDTNVH